MRPAVCLVCDGVASLRLDPCSLHIWHIHKVLLACSLKIDTDTLACPIRGTSCNLLSRGRTAAHSVLLSAGTLTSPECVVLQEVHQVGLGQGFNHGSSVTYLHGLTAAARGANREPWQSG